MSLSRHLFCNLKEPVGCGYICNLRNYVKTYVPDFGNSPPLYSLFFLLIRKWQHQYFKFLRGIKKF